MFHRKFDAIALQGRAGTLLGLFATSALLLAALGIYGVLSYSVSERTREIGLRMALGADRASTVRRILHSSALLIGSGIGFGLVAAVLLARSLSGLLYGMTPFDLPAFAIAATILAMVGLAASFIPARRATRVDPMVALRDS